MSQDHRLQRQRFELKYQIPESVTAPMRDFVRSYLELDEYGADSPDLRYPVHSLYLDSPDLQTFHASVNGAKNRFKLRLRYYDEKPHTPVFFEIKGRVDNCILKQRCGVRRSAVSTLLSGHLPHPDDLMSHEPRHLAALQQFFKLQQGIQATPKAHVFYTREAWVSHNDNSVRVTFDRHVHIEPCFKSYATTQSRKPIRVFQPVILEVKFTTRFPDWLEDLVRTFNLMRGSASKYCEGVIGLGESQFHDGDRATSEADLDPFFGSDRLAAAEPVSTQSSPDLESLRKLNLQVS